MNAGAFVFDRVQRCFNRPHWRTWLDWERARRILGSAGRRRTASLAVGAILSCLAVLALGAGYRYEQFPEALTETATLNAAAAAPAAPAQTAQLARERERLRAALSRTAPRGTYIVVDRSNNRVYLRRQDRLLLTANASAGSGSILREEGGRGRTWVFDTPQGVFEVRTKLEDPVWKKPDWAFIEEGRPMPLDPSERFEYGVLGEYALYFGDGYLIHGTLYERLLGRNVTHGCIRLGREDLRKVYAATKLGTPIYVF